MQKVHHKDQHWMIDRNLNKKAPLPPCSLKTPSPCKTFRKLRWAWRCFFEPQALVTPKIDSTMIMEYWNQFPIKKLHQNLYMSNIDSQRKFCPETAELQTFEHQENWKEEEHKGKNHGKEEQQKGRGKSHRKKGEESQKGRDKSNRKEEGRTTKGRVTVRQKEE